MKKFIIIIMLLSFVILYGEDNIEQIEEIYCIDEVPTSVDMKKEYQEFNSEELTVDMIISIINKGVSHWNQFRVRYPNINYMEYRIENADFSDKDLSGIDLSFMNFYNSKFMRVNLENANLFGANFIECNFFRANIKNSNLNSTNAIRSGFKSVVLANSDMDNATISRIWRKSFRKKNIKNYRKINWR